MGSTSILRARGGNKTSSSSSSSSSSFLCNSGGGGGGSCGEQNLIMSIHQPFDGRALPLNTTVVPVDKGKTSVYAFRWALNHLDSPIIVALHVGPKHIPSHEALKVFPPDESDVANVFSALREVRTHKVVTIKEAVVDDSDVVKGISDFANHHHINSIVIGATASWNSLARKFIGFDLPTAIIKSAPDYTSVYVISKGKIVSARSALRPMSNIFAPSKQPLALQPNDVENGVRAQAAKRGGMTEGSERTSSETNKNRAREKSSGSSSMDKIDLPSRGLKPSVGPDSFSDESVSSDLTKQDLVFSFSSDGSRTSSSSQPSKELEAEMKRLRLELKQTMDMYSSACKEAISAKNKADEINQWKLEEARKLEEAILSGEAALALAEKEKARARAAIEEAEEAKKMAEKEAERRRHAEIKARKEAAEKDRALTALAKNDVRYRKYTIEEIEKATEKFSPSLKIGEGGYGPVFKGELDHTPVAIKILRPDAAQGRKQFQQEVEVLCCIRHPNMVLLLGACPDYGCLVYEYMENGSLEDRLFRKNNSPPLSWRLRFTIAAEIATALLFLHQSKPEPLVHRDLKPANILLDRNYVSKISDVGLARLVPPSVADSVTQYYMTAAAGTFCYIDPEYQQTGKLTTKSDVYSLGIMLLQVVTARPPMGLSHQVKRAIEKGRFSEMLDPTVTDWPVKEALAFAKVAVSCAELSKKDRPDLATVVVPELNRLRNFGLTSHPS
ncbi:U-box domain-containing protein 34-like isoform X2 [Prosopis cineraria]|uniref:U-box domain-containing protein 34-like isoform X2 n=1 Tax=Prosopis cineraria TaxID=364024 RepID=UPI00240EAAAF|nr:U-box domain-containing protein 34-like isoform X2 [Prosopis cineraria]